MGQLVLKRAALGRPSGQWDDDNLDVLADGEVVGRIYKANAALGLDVDSSLLAPREPHADARLRGDARGCDGSIRQKLAAGIELHIGQPLDTAND